MPRGMTPKDRLLSLCSLNQAGCWLWASGKDSSGYGMFWYSGRSQRAHRASWLIFKGPIPAGKKVLHKCDVPGCVNPEHLFIGTEQDNTDDMRRKGRDRYDANPPRGERQGASKLSALDVQKIRDDPRKNAVIALEFGLNQCHVSRLKSGKRWQHLKEKNLG